MAYSEKIISFEQGGIDWTHEYAGCNPAQARAARKARRRRQALRLAVWGILEVAAAVLLAHLLLLYLGLGVKAAPGGGPADVNARAGVAEPPALPGMAQPGAPELPAQAPGLPAGAAAAALRPVQPVLQNPELPNGCEASSLAALLGYHGFAADKTELAYHWMPRQDLAGTGGGRRGPSPWEAYAGDPAGQSGFYCFAGPVCQGANDYLKTQESELRCRDLTGAGLAEVDALLAEGHPVMLWATIDYEDGARYASGGWHLPDGSWYTPYSNLHCVVAYGCNAEGYRLADPLAGDISVARPALEAAWLALGGHAAVIE